MRVYCDRLTPASIRAASSIDGVTELLSLDSVGTGWRQVARRIVAGASRLPTAEQPFLAGHVHAATGEAVYVAARRATTGLSLEAARLVVGGDRVLSELNAQFGRDRIVLHIARGLWREIEFATMRVLLVDALARSPGPQTLLLKRPVKYDGALLQRIAPRVRVVFYGGRAASGTALRLGTIAALRALKDMSRSRRTVRRPVPSEPAVLMVQEDDLSIDRTYRTQPHWVLPDAADGAPIHILTSRHVQRLAADDAALLARRIHLVDPADAATLAAGGRNDEADARWRAAIRRCTWRTLTSGAPATAAALGSVWRLLARARVLDGISRALNVKTFVCGDSHLADADAMQLVSAAGTVSTVTYQYSNLAFPTPPMMTTADTMLVFGPSYRAAWFADGIAPAAFEEIGYVFDSAFPLLKGRAAAHRASLRAAGARFVICYFDENCSNSKYALTTVDEHRDEIRRLMDLLLADPLVGLIVKCQFEANSPSRRYAGDSAVQRAKATGRYLELRHGRHRNIVFPAEAAMASDLVIGHAVGATAALESACAGTRAVMINPYRMHLSPLYDRAPIVFRTLEAALEAVARYRSGHPGVRDLGDWSPILPELVSFRDGQAAVRMRSVIEARVHGGATMPDAFRPMRAS